MAEDTKRPNRIAEAACHFVGGELFHEVGAQSLVLTVARVIGREKEASFGRYSITMTGIHTVIMLAAGLANKEIAARLNISDHTAKFHVAAILGKLGAATRTEAVALGIRRGLVLL